jgi:type I restriction-modification system DNA methylase subunit
VKAELEQRDLETKNKSDKIMKLYQVKNSHIEAILDCEFTEDADDRLLKIYEYLLRDLQDEKVLDN